MTEQILAFLKKHFLIFSLFVVQCFLFYYRFTDLPFAHDELSALYRCRFNTFYELMLSGVKVDGHPAGIQFFLWCIVQVFGYSEWALKVTGLLAGNLCLFFLYKSSERLFNRESALLTSVLFVCSNYFISHFSTIRPYGPGLMFNLASFYFLLETLEKKPGRLKYYIFAWIALVGSLYSHYFSFLQGLLIFSLFPLFFKTNYLKIYLILGIGLLSFLPHINLTWHQLSLGGLAWLQVPDVSFIYHFFYHLFNYSNLFLAFGSILFVLAFFKNKTGLNFKFFLSILCFLPLIILWLYAYFRAPVLQEPALFFSCPFLFMVMGTAINKKQSKYVIIALAILLGLYTLIFEMKFYKTRYFQAIKASIEEQHTYNKNHPLEKTLFLWHGNSNYFKLYQMILNKPLDVAFTEFPVNIDLSRYDQVFCNHLPAAYMYQISEKFNHCNVINYDFLYERLHFTHQKDDKDLYNLRDTFELQMGEKQIWGINKTFEILDSLYYSFEEFKILSHDSINCIYEVYADTLRLMSGEINYSNGGVTSVKIQDLYGAKFRNSHKTIKLFLHRQNIGPDVKIRLIHLRRQDNPYKYTGK